MKKITSAYYRWIKIIVLVASYGYLFYRLFTLEYPPDLKTLFSQWHPSLLFFLLLTLLLLPVNWLLESLKWKRLISPFEDISLKTAVYCVLSGLSTGFFTPGRIGELPGRTVFLKPENRINGIIMSGTGSFFQTIVTCMYGITGMFFFIFDNASFDMDSIRMMKITGLCFIPVFLGLLLFLPKISKFLSRRNVNNNIQSFLRKITVLSLKDMIYLLLITCIRYAVYALQFYFVLLFCGVTISISEAFIAISVIYLFVTITPSFAITEAGVRGSYSILFLGTYSSQTAAIAYAGILIWIINFVIPMFIGSYLFSKSKLD